MVYNKVVIIYESISTIGESDWYLVPYHYARLRTYDIAGVLCII